MTGGEEEIRTRVRRELTDVRTRGYVRLDAPNFRKQISTYYLERAAEKVEGYHANLTRIASVEQLLKYEIPLLPNPIISGLRYCSDFEKTLMQLILRR